MGRLCRALLTWKGTPWAGGTLVLVLGALALVLLTGSLPVDTTTVPRELATDITYGPEGAPVVVVEYADFQCEACATFSPILASLRAEYGDRVRFVFRFFPLNYHRYGMVSAQAAYAAFQQGKFWEMQDLLYERQGEWSDAADPLPFFDAYAATLALDIPTFHEDMAAKTTIDLIERLKAEASADGVHRAPFFAINGSAVLLSSYAAFKARIDALL